MKKEKKDKPKYNMWQNSWYMIKLAWREKEKKVLVISLITALLAVGINLVNLYLAPTVLAAVEKRVSVAELFSTIVAFVGANALMTAGVTYCGSNEIFGNYTIRMVIFRMLNQKAATTSYPNVEDERFSKLLARGINATWTGDVAAYHIWKNLSSLIENVLGFLFYAHLLVIAEPVLMVTVLLTTVGSYFCGNYADSYLHTHREEDGGYLNQLHYISDKACDISAAKDIRIFGLRPWLEEMYTKVLEAYRMYNVRLQNVYLRAKMLDVVLTFLRGAAAYAYLIHKALSGGLSASQFLLYFSAVNGFAAWVTGIFETLRLLHRSGINLSSMRECLEYPEVFAFAEGESLERKENQSYEIRLENVSFRYPGAEKDILTNINLTLHPGEKLAVVGLNGAGKTTLVKLICGFLDPTEGRVLLNGVDVRTYNRGDYYRLFSAVFQTFSLLAGTLAMNVAQSEDEIDMERVETCLEKAGLLEKVKSLPMGLETKLNREVYEDAIMLSGGETQRLMLARALYKESSFIVLDEPTAALDPIAESDMYQKYHEMTKDKSSVYISHRLASTRFCDRIILLENAGIAEEGTHRELVAAGRRYAELFAVQSKYYQEGGDEHGNQG